MREITDHIVNPINDRLEVTVTDEPGAGGASHRYEVKGFQFCTNPSLGLDEQYDDRTIILFQNGPIAEVGVNGITHEALLAIVADRLKSFQAGPYANDYNAAALAHVQSAMGALFDRTRQRMARGVEGTHAA